MKNLEKSKKIIITMAMIIAVIILGIIIFGKNFSQIRKQLDLGYQYLRELEWEPAIAAFDAAIDIDPKNEEAYIGKADAYIGKAEAGGSKEDIEKAIEVLVEGYYATSSNTIRGKIEEIVIENGLDIDIPEIEDKDTSDNAENKADSVDPALNDSNNKGNNDSNDSSSNSSNIDSDNQADKNDSANTNESNGNVSNPGDGNGVLTQDKLEQLSMDISRAYSNYIGGEIDNDRVEALCAYWIPILEEMKDDNSADVNLWGLSLSRLYYMNQDFSACTDMLNELYNLTGIEAYKPGYEEAVSSSFAESNTSTGTRLYNEYGNTIKENYTITQDDEFSYTEEITTSYTADGKTQKIIMHNEYIGDTVMHTELSYEYDSQGRLIKKTDNTVITNPYDSGSSGVTVTICTYEGNTINQQTHSEHTDAQGVSEYDSSATGVMDEYGATWDGWTYK